MGRARRNFGENLLFFLATLVLCSVLPVPAFPDKVTSWILVAVNTFSANDCSAFLGRIPYDFSL